MLRLAMRARVRLLLALVLPVPVLAQAPAPSSVPGGAVPAWMDALMARIAHLPDRAANFQEERRLAALSQTLVSSGQVVFRHPAHFEKITVAPRPERMIIDNDQVTLDVPGASARTQSLQGEPQLEALVDALRGPLSGDLSTLRRHFQLRIEGAQAAWRLTLLPITQALAASLREVVIDGGDIDIHSVRTTLANGDTDVMTVETMH